MMEDVSPKQFTRAKHRAISSTIIVTSNEQINNNKIIDICKYDIEKLQARSALVLEMDKGYFIKMIQQRR